MARNSTVQELGLGFLRVPSRGLGSDLDEQPVRDHPLALTLSIAPCEKSRNFFGEKAMGEGEGWIFVSFPTKGATSEGEEAAGSATKLVIQTTDRVVRSTFCVWACHCSHLQPISAVGFAVEHVRISGPFDGRFDRRWRESNNTYE